MVVQVALCGLAALLPNLLRHASNASVDHAFTVLSSGIAIAAAILVALGAWLSTSGRAVRIAFAVLVYEAFLLVEAVELDPVTHGQLVRDITMIGVAVLCGLAVRRVDVVGHAWRTSALIASAVVISCAIVLRVSDTAPLAGIQHALDVSTWAATAVVGLVLVCCGTRDGNPLLRRVGLALLTFTAAPVLRAVQALPPDQPSLTASAFGLAGVAMLLAAAVPFAVGALRTVWRELAHSQSRLQAAEQAMANSAVRDHEMRNLVAGLSGAESVLAAQEADEGLPEDRRLLRAAAPAELERLRRMLDSEGVGLGPSGPSSVAVAPLLSDLAALHGTSDREHECG
ncbi:MAG: hypothetical protein M3460_20200 [Actinomycetota bacterium]|nr:hypothetical protein [Actinomycetota bacterium]